MFRPITFPSTGITLENQENVMEQDATRCICITCKKLKLWHRFCWHFKNNLRTNAKGAQPPMFEALRFGKQDKRLAVLFPNFSVNVLHLDGTSMIFITVPRLFSSLAAIYITIVWTTASLSQHLAGYIQLVDQLSEIVVYVRSFEILQWILCQLQ